MDLMDFLCFGLTQLRKICVLTVYAVAIAWQSNAQDITYLPPITTNTNETYGGKFVLEEGFQYHFSTGTFRATAYAAVLDGGFETPVIPSISQLDYQYRPSGGVWEFFGQSGVSRDGSAFTIGNPSAPEGDQVLFLQNDGFVEMNFHVAQGGFYRFRFEGAKRASCCGPQVKNVRLYVAGYEVAEFRLENTTYTEYLSLPLYLYEGSNSIKLEGVNPEGGTDHTGFIDNLRIDPVDSWWDSHGSDPGANYVVNATETLVIDGNINAKSITVYGDLIVPQNRDLNLTAEYILLDGASASFTIGQELTRYTQQAAITLTGPDADHHPMMGNKFLATNGGRIDFFGRELTSWTHLDATASSEQAQITLAEVVSWQKGDQIVIASSGTDWQQAEERTIQSIMTVGNRSVIELTENLDFRHYGQKETFNGNGQTWVADLRAEVGLLTHNIKVQGDASSASTEFGGHFMITGTSKVHFDGVELYRMGQKSRLGRYPFHWHIVGNEGDGQYLRNSSIHKSYNRAVTIHETNKSLVESNVFYDHLGHGVFFENGKEVENVVRNNLALSTKTPQPTTGHHDLSDFQFSGSNKTWQNATPASYWITNPNNTIYGNVAAGTEGTGFWFIFPVGSKEAPFGSFSHNVAHSCSNGFDIFDRIDLNNNTINTNHGWLDPADHIMSSCLWYANTLGVYSGSGANAGASGHWPKSELNRNTHRQTENLIFDNNIFIDNRAALMLASHNEVRNSIFVSESAGGLNPLGPGGAESTDRTLVHGYDGGFYFHNNHLQGFNQSGASFIWRRGAAVTFGNMIIEDVTTAGDEGVDFNLGEIANPIFWNATIWDKDGSLSGSSDVTILQNHPFNMLGGETIKSGWGSARLSPRRYVNTRLTADTNNGHLQFRVIRSKAGTSTVTVLKNPTDDAVFPFVVNDKDLLYTYDFQGLEHLPSVSKKLGFYLLRPGQTGDYVIVKFKDFGSLSGLTVTAEFTSLTQYQDFAALKASQSGSGYCYDGGHLYLKASAVAGTGPFPKVEQFFLISWSAIPGGRIASEIEEPLDNKSGITLYPNPTSTFLYLDGVDSGSPYEVSDITGKRIVKGLYFEPIAIRQLKAGVYQIHINDTTLSFIKE